MTVGTRRAASRLRRHGMVVAASLLAVVLLAACGREDGTLETLRSDRMARAAFDGAELVSEREREASSYVKAAPAVVRRTFAVTGDPPTVLANAVEAARAWGWSELPGTASFTAERTIDGVDAVLLLFVEDSDDDVLLQLSIESA